MKAYPTSLFDYDFDLENYIQALDRAIWRTDLGPSRPMAEPAPEVDELPEVIDTTLKRLKTLAFMALDDGRMEAYFRLLDEIDRYEAAQTDDEEMIENYEFIM